MADLYNVAAGAYQAGRARAQSQRLNQLAQLAMSSPDQFGQIAPRMAGVDATAGLNLSNAIQQRQLADAERERTRALGLARYLQQIPATAREGVAAAYRKRAPDLPMSLDDDSLGAYVSMAQASGMVNARVQSTKIGEDGQIYNVMSDGTIRPTGVMAENRQQVFKGVDAQGRPIFGAFDPRAGSIGGFGGEHQQMPPPTVQPTQGGSIPVPGGRIDVADPAAMQFLRDNPQVAAGLASGRPFDIPAQPAGGMLVGPDPVVQAARTAGAQEQAKIDAQLGRAADVAAAEADAAAVKEGATAAEGRAQDLIANATKMQTALRNEQAKVGNIVTAIETARRLTSPQTTGVAGAAMRRVPGSPAFDRAEAIETIRANLGFDRLQEMRDASQTGGALGAIAVQELDALRATVASINPDQSQEAFLQNLATIEQQYERAFRAFEQATRERISEAEAARNRQFQTGSARQTAPSSARPRLRYNPQTGDLE